VNAAVPPCFPALDQGRTAWAALTGGGRRRLLYFTGAICPLDWGWQGEFDLLALALRGACRASHRAFPARWRMVYYSCRDVYDYGFDCSIYGLG